MAYTHTATPAALQRTKPVPSEPDPADRLAAALEALRECCADPYINGGSRVHYLAEAAHAIEAHVRKLRMIAQAARRPQLPDPVRGRR